MIVTRSPSGIRPTREHGTSNNTLGDGFEWSFITDALAKVGPTAAQVYANQQAAKTQAAALKAQQQSAMLMQPYNTGLYPQPKPAWLMPALIGGGVLALALVLRK